MVFVKTYKTPCLANYTVSFEYGMLPLVNSLYHEQYTFIN